MRQRFWSVAQATSSSHLQRIRKPPVHFSNFNSHRGNTAQLAAGVPAGAGPAWNPKVVAPAVAWGARSKRALDIQDSFRRVGLPESPRNGRGQAVVLRTCRRIRFCDPLAKPVSVAASVREASHVLSQPLSQNVSGMAVWKQHETGNDCDGSALEERGKLRAAPLRLGTPIALPLHEPCACARYSLRQS